jgi:hypothetical protein
MSTFNLNKPTGDYRISFGKNILSNNQNVSNEANTTNNKTKNIRLTLTPSAVRNNKFNINSGNFDAGYPLNTNKTLCDDKLSTIFNTGNTYWTKDFSTEYSYPVIGNLDIVSSNELITCNGDDGDNCVETPCNSGFTFDSTQCSCVSCASIQCLPGQIFDPVSCLCVSPPTCIGQGECPPVTIPEIKTTIYGYAFYLDVVRTLNIPDISTPVQASCAGGHRCCRTLFKPKIVKADQSEILADRNISMDNSEYMGCSNDTQIPVPGFIPLSPNERSDTFTITLNNPSDITNAALYLDCQYSSCHNGVTFVVLVAELASSTDKIVIFSSCVSPGSINRKPIGTIDCPGEEGLCNGDIAYSCYDGVCRNVVDMGGIFGQGLWLNDQFCGGECDPPPCEENESCCLSNYCSYEYQTIYETFDLENLTACESSNIYNCCNGTVINVACEPAGFNSSVSGNPLYDCTVIIGPTSSPSP